MTPIMHRLYIYSLVAITLVATVYLAYTGYSYYNLPLEERFYHPRYDWFKPSGLMGQGLGVVGTIMMAFGVGIYIARKRYGFLQRFIRLKYLLEFHIFLCTLGPILILFHTSFKFGGIVSIAFWSMVIVVASGVIGRFIYVQIPHTIDGKALSQEEIDEKRNQLIQKVSQEGASEDTLNFIRSTDRRRAMSYADRSAYLKKVTQQLQSDQLSAPAKMSIISNIKKELTLARKQNGLQKMKKLFSYWHVAHLPFAIILLIVVIIHVSVAFIMGYKWIF